MASIAKFEEAEKKGLKQKKNPDGEKNKEPEKVVKLKKLDSTGEEMKKMMVQLAETNKHYACFKPKVGSVFPAKRKSVKRMMFDRFLLQYLWLCFSTT